MFSVSFYASKKSYFFFVILRIIVVLIAVFLANIAFSGLFLVKLSVANACRTATRIAIGLFWPHWRLRMMKNWRWRLMIEAVLSNHVLDDLGHWRWHIGRHSVRIRLQIGVYVIRRVNFSLDTFRAPISQGHVGKYDLAILNFC